MRRAAGALGALVMLVLLAACDGRIAFADKTGIHTVNPDGSDRRTVVAQWGARFPRWSPDGELILYEQRNAESQRGNVPIRTIRASSAAHPAGGTWSGT